MFDINLEDKNDLELLKTSFAEKHCMKIEDLIKYKFPEIQNLSVDMNEEGEVSIIFDETIYTQTEVQDFINEFKKTKK